MTQQHENLSAIIDGEGQDESIISALKSDQALHDKWQRYHLIRQGLRKELPETINFDIASNVAKALADEPAILAPKRTWRDLPVVASVIPIARQGGQFAIAASVAVAMVLGVQQFNQPETQQQFNAAPATVPGALGGLSPVSLEQTRAVPRADMMEQRRLINAYLTDHNQQLRLKASEQAAAQANKQTTPDEKANASEENPE